MAGPVHASEVTISTACLNRVLGYEPRDLTISVEAGMPFLELQRILAENRQMIPLDPPFAGESTIGGVLGANLSGHRRRLYGSARDMVIGMTFATLEGKLIRTGGMVVKNVAGLDMAKLMIGSFGTLAAIATVNFKLYPMPAITRTFSRRFSMIGDAIEARDSVLKSVLQPMALDLIKDVEGFRLLLQAGGSAAVLERYSRELHAWETLEGIEEQALWGGIREFTPEFLKDHSGGAVVRISCPLTEVKTVLERLPAPAIARAGTGVVYGYFERTADALGHGLIEFAPPAVRESQELWPAPGDAFPIMQKIKHMLDPQNLLNRGRLYGRI